MKISELIYESATRYVYRIDSELIPDFSKNMQTYHHTADFSRSGRFEKDAKIPKEYTGKVTGVYAGDKLFTALYATGNADKTRYVAIYDADPPTVYFDKKDLARLKSNHSYLTVFDAKNFRRLPTGEWFSENPGSPVEQIEITDPFQYIRQVGWKIKVADDLPKLVDSLRRTEKKWGAEGISEQRIIPENFADGRNPGRKGLSRRVGIPRKATLTQLEKIAKSSTGERRRMAQWQLNMRRGKKKK